jgi:hypothetical protein
LAIALLAQEPAAVVPATPAGPPVYEAAKGPILLPNLCAQVDLESLGLTCSDAEPCPTFLELGSSEVNNEVIVLAGNLHTSAVTIQSILLVSDDNGLNWREAHPRLPSVSLDGLQFFDFSNGWLSGHSSLSLPRDPFLLISSDGGRSWRKSSFHAESRVGIVEDFAFSTARRGWALIDNKGSGDAGRYELYETPNGGSSWELKEISTRVPKAVAALGQRAPSGTTRFKADSKKDLITLERRSGEQWRPVVSFRLKLEDCAPVPPQP